MVIRKAARVVLASGTGGRLQLESSDAAAGCGRAGRLRPAPAYLLADVAVAVDRLLAEK